MAASLCEEVIDDGDTSVDLGFAEKCDNQAFLTSLFFPSKIGGRPAWLRWDSLPTSDVLQCANCRKQLILLCQIYVPLELPVGSDISQLHHRTLYLFCCRNGPCSKYKSTIKVLRTERVQKPDEPNYEESDLSEAELLDKCRQQESQYSLCNVCGCHGDKVCSSCRKVKYCCKDHQTLDWKCQHKKECQGKAGDFNTDQHQLLFNEYEIVIEAEPKEKLKKVDLSELKPADPKLERDLLKIGDQKTDEAFINFKIRVEREPEQVIRYDLGKKPLWVSSENVPGDGDIPDCCCGAKRQFEFQVLPQMINYLGVETTIDSIDWGTLCVFTCSNNCTEGDAYKEEYVWKQDFS